MVIVAHDLSDTLERNLPHFLTVAGKAHGEVIVVDDASTDDTPDVLKRYKAENEHLYTTFLPQAVRNTSNIRLAMNIGAKAALSKRIVFADITRPPLCDEWLTGFANGEVTAVYCRLKHGQPQVTHQLFDDLQEATPYVLKAECNGGLGHRGRIFRFRTGLYDAIAVNKDQSTDIIKLFDHHYSAMKRFRMCLKIFIKNMFA